ncbi:MAG: YoaK family protein [Caldilineaceae bacterium]
MTAKDRHPPAQDEGVLRNVLLLLLAATAGAVDVISYVELGRVFTANMTGNTVLLGLALGRVEPQSIVHAGLALVGFLIGVALGVWLVGEPNHDHEWTGWVTLTLTVEAILLVGVLVAWQRSRGVLDGKPLQLLLIVETAAAMGLQTAAVRDLAIAGVVTTYVTGTLTSLFGRMVRRVSNRLATERQPAGASWLLGAIWLVYVVSATGTAALIRSLHGWVLGWPIALVVLVIAVAAIRFR